jgi:outer membrane protein assembly factor BamB
MRILYNCWITVTVILAFSGLRASAQEWTRFRGPNGTGVSAATTIPVQFTESDYNWRVELPGTGHSSPVLWGKKIFLTSAEEEKGKRYLLCLNAVDGKVLWSKPYEFARYRKHQFNTSASSTPAVDADRVYVLWATHDAFSVHALDHQGNEVWRKDLGAFPTQHGVASSPIVVDDLLIFAKEPEDSSGSLIALDKKTGAPRWKRDRSSKASPYMTPILYRPKTGPAELIFTSTAHGVTSLDPRTGDLNWEIRDIFKARCVAGPVVAGDLIFQAAGTGGGDREAVAVRPGSKQAGTHPEVVFKVMRGISYVPCPLVHAGKIIMWGDAGIVTCLKADTGDPLWSERVGGNFFGSPVLVNGKIYAMNSKGELVVAEPTDTGLKVLARNDLGEASHATPAVADDVMYLRTLSHLISVGGKKPAAKQP